MNEREFPLWLVLANWWLQHRRKSRGENKHFLTPGTWIFLLQDLKKSMPVPHGRLEKWVAERLLVWIDGQIWQSQIEIQAELIRINMVAMHPDWRCLFKNVTGIRL